MTLTTPIKAMRDAENPNTSAFRESEGINASAANAKTPSRTMSEKKAFKIEGLSLNIIALQQLQLVD
jgi:hypothetical protein